MPRGRAPRCFQDIEIARRWSSSARYASPGSSHWCADCTAKFQREMIEEGLCDFPETVFVTDPRDGTTVGKRTDPDQVELFDPG